MSLDYTSPSPACNPGQRKADTCAFRDIHSAPPTPFSSTQTRYLLCDAPGGPLGPRHALGLALWAAGFAINLQSDSLLIHQRRAKRAKDGGYSIPHGGLFGLVSCANYFGEVVEWAGWALAGASLPAAAFALFTAANLVPRCAG